MAESVVTTQELQDLLQMAYSNNSFTYDVMHSSLKQTWMNSFSYLYTHQKACIEYEELWFDSNDVDSHDDTLIGRLHLDEIDRAYFEVDYDLIHCTDREEYRLSEYYQNEFTIRDIVYHPSIFKQMPIVMIDDQYISDYKILITKDATRFILPFHRDFVVEPTRDPEEDDLVYLTHRIKVQIVDNLYYERLDVTKAGIHFDNADHSIMINKREIYDKIMVWQTEVMEDFYCKKFHVHSVDEMTYEQKEEFEKELHRRLHIDLDPKQKGIMFVSFLFLTDTIESQYLGTEIIPLDEEQDYYYTTLTRLNADRVKNYDGTFTMTLFYVPKLYKHVFWDESDTTTATANGARLLVVEKDELVPYNMPIPVEDFMVFKYTSTSKAFILQENTKMLEMHYPNIYRIKDENMYQGNVYKIYYFYHDMPELKYTVLFDFYYRFLLRHFKDTPFEQVINDIYYNTADFSDYTEEQLAEFKEVFQSIYDYEYHKHLYGEIDFVERYTKLPGNEDKTPIEYKDETFREWSKVNPWMLRDYVMDQKQISETYHLFTNTLDLSTRIRRDTKQELGEKGGMVFPEDRYVFSFNNERSYPKPLDLRIFVDGVFIVDFHQERKLFTDYIYIPVSQITEDSYIEVEILPNFSFEQPVEFSSLDETLDITLVESEDVCEPTIGDLYFIEDNGTKYGKDFFTYVKHTEYGDIEVASVDPLTKPIRYTQLQYFSITPNSPDILDKELNMVFWKKPGYYPVRIKEEGYPILKFVGNELRHNFSNEFIRIFNGDGRLISRNDYRLIPTFKNPLIFFMTKKYVGDMLYVDFTPYRYRLIYSQEELIEGEITIDLSGYISKPFDIRYYDVYLNGRRLSLNNVFSITPSTITLVNLHSIYNLDIYEKERDWEYFGLDYSQNIYYYSETDLLNSSFVTEEERNEIIKYIIDTKKDSRLNIYPNENTEIKYYTEYDIDRLNQIINFIYYWYILVPFRYVQPSKKQPNKELMEEVFPEIRNVYFTHPAYNAETDEEYNRKLHYPGVIFHDPDTLIKCKESEAGEDHPMLVYEIGHFTEDAQTVELLNDLGFSIDNTENLEN